MQRYVEGMQGCVSRFPWRNQSLPSSKKAPINKILYTKARDFCVRVVGDWAYNPHMSFQIQLKHDSKNQKEEALENINSVEVTKNQVSRDGDTSMESQPLQQTSEQWNTVKF